MQRELPMPDFLKEDVETIHKRMLEKAPPDVNITEGDFFWDTTRPTAEEKAELIQLKLQNFLKLAFPQSSYGIYLEYLGELKGVFKNPSTKSSGYLKIKGNPGTILEKSKIVGTISTDTDQSIEFELKETKVIDDTGIAYVKVECTQEGKIGNVPIRSIAILITPINGVESITNEEEFTGGTEIEDEEHYRERVLEAEQEENLSGADGDYVKWAKEVPGVGIAWVISEWNGSGTVKILILDANGQPANEELISAVQKYIAPIVPSGQNRGGKAPVGATITVSTPSVLKINVQAHFEFEEGYSETDVLDKLKTEKLSSYISKVEFNGTVVYNVIYSIIGSMILNKEGLKDFSNLTINGLTTNIQLVDQVSSVGEVISI